MSDARSPVQSPVTAALLAAVACIVVAFPVRAQQTPAQQPEEDDVLRVCADPNNLPQSNQKGEGYENKIAERLARDLGRRIEYTYFPQRMGFVRNTLRGVDERTRRYKCDVIIGVPKGYELTLTTRPYMRSTYAMIFPEREELKGIRAVDDLLKLPPETLQELRIGVFAHSPGSDWLLRNKLARQAVYYPEQSGDPAEHPASIIGRDLTKGNIDLAIVWGPVAGYLARTHSGDARWAVIPFLPDPQIKFDYEISMGVRFGEKKWRDMLDSWIASHQADINEILMSYGVPLLDENGRITQAACCTPDSSSAAPRPQAQVSSASPAPDSPPHGSH